jgi:Ca-activated chloride channel family protein
MSFLEPIRLWLLLGAAALAGAYVFLQFRRRAYALRFTNLDLLASVAPKRPGWRRHAAAAVFLLAVTALVLGFAQPARDTRIPRERATIMMAIDTSLSMDATDVSPSRIDAAKEAAKRFLDVLPPKINVGLVSFNGAAAVEVPPTVDRDLVRMGIDNLELGESTAIGEAIFTSLDAIDTVPPDDEGTPPPARIVLMSDGATQTGRPNATASEAARQEGVAVSTIAFGTDNGTIMVPEQPYPVPVPVDKPSLRAIADDTGGTFYSAGSEQQLTEVYENIGSSVGYETEQREITTWFVAGALVLLLLGGTLSLLWFSRLP